MAQCKLHRDWFEIFVVFKMRLIKLWTTHTTTSISVKMDVYVLTWKDAPFYNTK